MKVLVVGSLPPPERARSKALRREVASMLVNGDTIEIVTPDPVATAHRYLAGGGLPGCVQLATMVAGFDSVVVQLQPGLPVRARAGRLERAVCLTAFALALRRARRVVLRLERPDDLPGGPGGRAALRLWGSAEEIVVAGEARRALFLAEVGKRADRLSVRFRSGEDGPEEESAWGTGDVASLENVMELVRKRAARERRALAPSDAAHIAGWDRLSTPGLAMTDSDTALLAPTELPRRDDIARRALAAADRRPMLWRFARAARLARRGLYAMLRPGRDD